MKKNKQIKETTGWDFSNCDWNLFNKKWNSLGKTCIKYYKRFGKWIDGILKTTKD